MPVPEDAALWFSLSSRPMTWARALMEVSGMRWERVAWWAETRRSHSRASAVARCGFEWGMVRGFLVVGVRRARSSRLTRRLFSIEKQTCQQSAVYRHERGGTGEIDRSEIESYHDRSAHSHFSKIASL